MVMSDRSKLPEGYDIGTGNPADRDDDRAGIWAHLQHDGPYATEDEALAACWRHHDRIAAEIRRQIAEEIATWIAEHADDPEHQEEGRCGIQCLTDPEALAAEVRRRFGG